jgi:hypothetical protein
MPLSLGLARDYSRISRHFLSPWTFHPTQTRDAYEGGTGDHDEQMSEENLKRLEHGRGGAVPIDALLADDPDVWLAIADMRAWSEAHPCECEALCECEQAA